jgi:hypothetical protein
VLLLAARRPPHADPIGTSRATSLLQLSRSRAEAARSLLSLRRAERMLSGIYGASERVRARAGWPCCTSWLWPFSPIAIDSAACTEFDGGLWRGGVGWVVVAGGGRGRRRCGCGGGAPVFCSRRPHCSVW